MGGWAGDFARPRRWASRPSRCEEGDAATRGVTAEKEIESACLNLHEGNTTPISGLMSMRARGHAADGFACKLHVHACSAVSVGSSEPLLLLRLRQRACFG